MKAMMRLVIFGLILSAAQTFFASAGLAENKAGCVQMLDGIICPAPHGGVSSGINGEVVCGPGECARDSKGVVRCSSLPGGSVILDINGNVLCVGGCVPGSRRYCVVPSK